MCVIKATKILNSSYQLQEMYQIKQQKYSLSDEWYKMYGFTCISVTVSAIQVICKTMQLNIYKLIVYV